MIHIRVPSTVRYTCYPDSKLATQFDRFCHSLHRLIAAALVAMLLGGYLTFSFDAMRLPDGISAALNGALSILLLLFWVSSFFWGLLCDKLRLSARLAAWEAARRDKGGKLPGKSGLWITAGCVLLLLPGLIAIACTLTRGAQDTGYHQAMTVLDGADSVPVTGVHLVSYDTESGIYSTTYIPEQLQAQTPEEVRYILRCTHGAELTGGYGLSGIGAYQRFVSLELTDRESGEVLQSGVIYGGSPPRSIGSDVTRDQYGSRPDESEVIAWVLQAYSEAASAQ